MKKVLLATLVCGLIILMVGPFAFAQSSGNFSAKLNTTKCLINDTSGDLIGGIKGSTFLETVLKTPNSASTALVIRPSLVSGLYTKTKVTDTVNTSTAYAGLKVRVLMDNKVVAPGTPVGCDVTIGSSFCPGTQVSGDDAGWVYYDKRWQQIDQNFLSILKSVATATDVTTPNELYLQLILSTLSAHSVDFVVGDVGGADHTLKVQWAFENSAASLTSDSAACVGPAVLTVEQVKTFSTGSGIVIQ